MKLFVQALCVPLATVHCKCQLSLHIVLGGMIVIWLWHLYTVIIMHTQITSYTIVNWCRFSMSIHRTVYIVHVNFAIVTLLCTCC